MRPMRRSCSPASSRRGTVWGWWEGKEKGGERSAERTADAKDNGFINTDVIARKVEDSRAAAHDRSEYSDSIPLFIVDGFSPDNKDKHNNFMAAFVQFAAQMTSAQLARFLFLTDSTLEENISKSMPDIKVTHRPHSTAHDHRTTHPTLRHLRCSLLVQQR